jgi:diguanylate cyclase (GGDEF)-like protein
MPQRVSGGTGLRSRLARRVLLLVLAASLLPVGIAVGLTYRHLQVQTTERSHAELELGARYLGLGLLADLQRAAAELSAQAQAAHAGDRNHTNPIVPAARGTFSAIEFRDVEPGTVPRWEALQLNALQSRKLLEGGAALVSINGGREDAGRLQLLLLDESRDHLAIGTIDRRLLGSEADSLAADAMVLLRDSRGRVLWTSVPADLAVPEPSGIAGAADSWTHEGVRYQRVRWDIFLASEFGAEPITVEVIRSAPSLLRQWGGLETSFPLLLLAALLLCGLITVRIVRRYIEPLHDFSRAAGAIAQRQFDVRLRADGDDELSELGAAFNSMAGELRQQFDSMEALSEVDRMLLESTDLEAVLGSLLPRIGEVTGAVAVAVVLRDDDSDDHARIFVQQRSLQRSQPVRRIALDWPAVERLVGRRRMCRSEELAAEVREHLMAIEVVPGAARQIWSLRGESRLAGLMSVEFADETSEQRPGAGIVGDFSDRVAVAVRNMEFTRRLYQKGHFDSLTGLPNRAMFLDRLAAEVERAQTDGQGGALLYLDLDSFKNVNDTSGHQAGDRLLEEVAVRMRASLGERGLIARLGGDEFAVLLPRVATADDAQQEATRLLAALAGGGRFGVGVGAGRPVTASIGICLFPRDGVTAAELLKHSDIAMYRAKESRHERVVFFAAEMQERMHHRAALEFGLRSAIEARELQLFYQPIYRGDELVGGEALLRWFTQNGEQISPATFIPIAEDCGLIHEVGRWALQEACRHRAAWVAQGVAPDYVSVNVAPEQLTDPQFVDSVRQALRLNRLDPAGVQLEITESALSEGKEAEQRLDALATLGVRLALDDFGTGYSSLGHLQRLPIDVIKIDRAFIMHVPHSASASRLLEAILQMGRGLDKVLIAEGVETVEQERFLHDHGCNVIQGFLRGRPMPAAEFGRLLAAQVGSQAADGPDMPAARRA